MKFDFAALILTGPSLTMIRSSISLMKMAFTQCLTYIDIYKQNIETKSYKYRESFQKGIKDEIESIHNELSEIREKKEKAEKIIEEKKQWINLRVSLMPPQQRANFEDENYIMQDARFFVKIVCVEKNIGNNYNSTSSNKNENLRIQIDIDDASYSTEERVFNEGVCYFQNNIFTLPITTGYEKIFLKVVEDEYSEVKASTQLKLSDFRDQRIHKRTYHLKPQKKYKDLQYDIQIRAFYQYNTYTFNRDKITQREDTYLNIMQKLDKREQRLIERLRGLEIFTKLLIASQTYEVLEHLDIICFNKQEESPSRQDMVIKVSKDYDSETASVYNEQNQAELFFQNGEEENNEFQRIKLYSDAPSPRSELGNFSFDNMSDDGGTNLNQQMLNHIIGSRRGSGYNTGGNTNTSSPFKLNLTQQQGGVSELAQFISPRFQNESTTQRQSLKINQDQKLEDKSQNKTLLELRALKQETSSLINNYEIKKNKIQQERKVKNSIYEDLSKMNKQDLIKFRIFARGLYAMNKLNNQQQQENVDNKRTNTNQRQKSFNRMV